MTDKKPLAAGDEVDSRCLKCKDVTNHTIIAMAAGEVAKVVCNVCKSQHKYRAPKPEKKAAAVRKTAAGKAAPKAPKVPKPTKAEKAVAYFEEMTSGRDSSKALSYAMKNTFKENDLLNHPTFGLGLVVGTVQPNKIEVLFKEGSKILICVL